MFDKICHLFRNILLSAGLHKAYNILTRQKILQASVYVYIHYELVQ